MNTTRVSNFFIEIRVVSYAENLDLLGFSVFLYFHAVFVGAVNIYAQIYLQAPAE